MIKKFFISLIFILFLCSCVKKLGNAVGDVMGYVFSNDEGTELFINIDTSNEINLNPYNQYSQPLKLCLFVVKNSNWVPDGLYEGIPCNSIVNNENIINSKQLMLSSNRNYTVKLPLVYNRKDTSDIWLIVAGNFQDFQSSTQIVHKKIKRTTKVKIKIKVDNNSILIQSKKK